MTKQEVKERIIELINSANTIIKPKKNRQKNFSETPWVGYYICTYKIIGKDGKEDFMGYEIPIFYKENPVKLSIKDKEILRAKEDIDLDVDYVLKKISIPLEDIKEIKMTNKIDQALHLMRLEQ